MTFPRPPAHFIATALAPVVTQWAQKEEARILSEGRALTPAEVRDAEAAGVLQPNAVRVVTGASILWPVSKQLLWLAWRVGLTPGTTIGVTLGHGIFLRDDYANSRGLLVHELAHVAQYEKLGGLRAFLRRYLFECLTVGYAAAPLEIEARAVERRVMQPGD